MEVYTSAGRVGLQYVARKAKRRALQLHVAGGSGGTRPRFLPLHRKSGTRVYSQENKDADTTWEEGVAPTEPVVLEESTGQDDVTVSGVSAGEREVLSSRDEPGDQKFTLSNLLVEMLRAFNATAPKAPWKLDTVLTVLILWIISFWISAYNVVPYLLSSIKSALLETQGVTLSYSGEAALRHLLLDMSQMVVIAVLLQRALRSYAYKKFFAIRSKSKSTLSWIVVGFGVAAFPAVDWLHKTMVTLFSGGGQFARNASTASASMFDGDGIYIKILWFVVLGVAAPVWEEIMFRGFLLPSLARATSPALGVLMTSVLFSLVHFTREGFLPLMILGTIFGISYCVTRGLFTPIMLHGLWNVCLLAQVMWRGGL